MSFNYNKLQTFMDTVTVDQVPDIETPVLQIPVDPCTDEIKIDLVPADQIPVVPDHTQLIHEENTAVKEAEQVTRARSSSWYIPRKVPSLVWSSRSFDAIAKSRTAASKDQEESSTLASLISNSANWLKRLSQIEETFYCKICMENCQKREQYGLTGCYGSCAHYFCKACLAFHLTQKINEGQIRVMCPLHADAHCGNFANAEDIQSLCTQKIIQKFIRFSKMNADQNVRECPFCENFQHGDSFSPNVTCERCNKDFCFFHANAHPSTQSCSDYLRSTKKDEKACAEEMRKFSKKCPTCKMPTQKFGGCNHMTCKCGAQWCWLCGKVLGNSVTEHYIWWNIRGCAGAQFQDDRIAGFLFCYRAYVVFAIGLGCLLLALFCMVFGVLMSLFLPVSKELRARKCLFFTDIVNIATFPAALLTCVVSYILATAVSITTTLFSIILSPIVVVLKRLKLVESNQGHSIGAEICQVAKLPFSIVSILFKMWQFANQ